MLFKLDENIPKSAGNIFTKLNLTVDDVHQENLRGKPDSDVFDAICKDNRILFTLDLGFLESVEKPIRSFPGIVIMRLKSQGRDKIKMLIEKTLSLMLEGKEPIRDHLWIASDQKIRIKKLV